MSQSIFPENLLTPVFWGEIAPCEHIAQFYEHDRALLDALTGFIGDGLKTGESTIVIATPQHLKALEQGLLNSGVDLVSAIVQHRYIALLADEALKLFMVDHWPDDDLFTTFVGDLIARAKANGKRVRAFGEMVALLWARGDVAATVRLEYLWEQLCKRQEFSLFCAYPKAGFTKESSQSLREICEAHSRIV
ncbi:MAG TPA: MEDS domain-containing protein [Candidatus Sulfotelmatobacter sp.]|nr:MEDS domain-containing protein [Candidatus Sulfotelmatobacter sp.]